MEDHRELYDTVLHSPGDVSLKTQQGLRLSRVALYLYGRSSDPTPSVRT